MAADLIVLLTVSADAPIVANAMLSVTLSSQDIKSAQIEDSETPSEDEN
ncbi:MAG: hypothetical protein F6J92_01075 [Symploca sp. SIO1A3]|nr:hypothetical protein [Symploca sp. SIO1A3]